MSQMTSNIANYQGKGAQFYAYISPHNDTKHAVTTWTVTIETTDQTIDNTTGKKPDQNWVGTITSDNPRQVLQTPNLSGIFKVTVTASGPQLPEKTLKPRAYSKPDVGCNSNCAAMEGIVALPDGNDANYWTTWDAICN